MLLSKFQSNKNTAVVEYMPRGEDHEKFLSCRGVNPHLPDLAVEDQWKITVHGKNYILQIKCKKEKINFSALKIYLK